MSATTAPTRLLLRLLAAVILSASAGAPAAVAAPSTRVLILSTTVSGGAASLEARAAMELGLDVEVADPDAWRAKTAAEFAGYRALILGDPGSASPGNYAAAADTASVWGPLVDGNALVIGTDPVDHASSGGRDLVRRGMAYVVDDAARVGLYASLSDAYDGAANGTLVAALDGLDPDSGFEVRGSSCYDVAHIVVNHPVIDTLTDASLSNWGCSVHNTFVTFPASFVTLAIAEGQGDFVAPDGTSGFPYILARGRTTTYAGRQLIALGDSVSAGEGIANGWKWHPEGAGDGQWEQDGPVVPWSVQYEPMRCHQTEQAHPRLLASALKADLFHRSCTGATANNGVLGDRVDDDGVKMADQQIDAGYAAAEPDLVTLSLGANDIRFADIVKDCVTPHPRLFDNADCRYDDADIDTRFTHQRAGLRDVLDRIAARGVAAGKLPLVALTQYVDPFPAQWSDRCPDLDIPFPGLTLSASEVDFMRKGLRRLNRSIAEIAAEYPNTVVVPPSTEFRDHVFCSTAPWTYGPSLVFDKGLQGLDDESKMTPFHPTPAGQQALADGLVGPLGAKVTARSGSNVVVRSQNGVRLTVGRILQPGAFTAPPIPLAQLPPNRSFRAVAGWNVVLAAQRGAGPMTLSLPSDDPGASIWHFSGGAWHELNTTWDGSHLNAETPSLSPFAVGRATGLVTASFEAPTQAAAPADLAFDGTSSTVSGPDAAASYEWNFGDGSLGTGATLTHRYARAGTYEVVLRLTSTAGAVDEARRTITITNTPPIALIDAVSEGPVGRAVQFSAARSFDAGGVIRQYEWQVDGGAWTKSDANFEQAFPDAGTHVVRLMVQDEDGAAALAEHTVIVGRPPTPSVQPTPTSGASAVIPVPRSSALGLSGARLRDRGRTVVVRATCTARQRCRGSITIRSQTGRALVKRSVTLGSGKVKTLRIPLPKPVKAGRRITLTPQLATETAPGAPLVVTRPTARR